MVYKEFDQLLNTFLKSVIKDNIPHRWNNQLKQYNPYEDINGDYYKDNIVPVAFCELETITDTLIEDAYYRSRAEKILKNILISKEKSKLIHGTGLFAGGIFGTSYYVVLRNYFEAWRDQAFEELRLDRLKKEVGESLANELAGCKEKAAFDAVLETHFDLYMKNLSDRYCLDLVCEH